MSSSLCPLLPSSAISRIRWVNSVNLSARSSRFIASRNFLYPHVFHWMQLQTEFRISLRLAVQTCLSISPLSIKNGDSAKTCKELCTVLWSVESDIADDYVIFLTGEPVGLGCWEPAMAVLLSPSSEQANLWMTEIKVPCGIQFKYNYFMKDEKQPAHNLVWRQGPEFSLSIPSFSRENEVIIVKDSWMRNRKHSLPDHSWGSWMLDIDLSDHHIKNYAQASPAGEHKVMQSLNGDPSGWGKISHNHATKASSSPVKKGTPKNHEEKLSERDQLVEEPWLLRTTLLSIFKTNELNEPSDQSEIPLIEFSLDLHHVAEKVSPEGEHKPVSAEQPVSTVILINSSVCTMQRIAILEDGKLVELLLEPVKNNVHCDSIYLGVVTKLVPHMSGAFVDIGISRPSLMGIKQNREPFVFPPFSYTSKEKVVDGFVNNKPKVLFDVHKHDHSSFNEDNSIDELVDDDHEDESLQLIHEDVGEGEEDDEMDVTGDHKIRVNSGAFDNGGDDANSEEYYEENGDQIEDEDFILEAESSIGLDLPQAIPQDLKDSSDIHSNENKWSHVRKGTKVIVQVVKEGLGTKGPALSAYPNLRSRFWVDRMVVDSPRTYHEVTSYLQEIAPDLCDRVELYDKRTPIFDEYNIEEEINSILSKRVPLSNGGSLVIEQTEALVSIDVNGGHGMLGQETSQEEAILDVNLAAAKQIARELRLRDIGGIIVVDFIDMSDESNKRLVYEEMKKAVERDRSIVRVAELSKHGLMEITRKRVRPSVTFMISEPCTCCHATGRIEALETSFSKIEHEIFRLLAASNQKPDPENAKSWPRFVLRVDRYMCNYLTSGKRTKLAVLSSSLKVWILLKVARGFSRGAFEVKPFTEENAKDDSQVAISRLRPTEARSYISDTKLTLFPVKKWKGRRK